MEKPNNYKKEYYINHKEQLNYDRKLRYNKNKYDFIQDMDDAKKWIQFRPFIFPFSKILNETDDIPYVLSLLEKYLKYHQEINGKSILKNEF